MDMIPGLVNGVKQSTLVGEWSAHDLKDMKVYISLSMVMRGNAACLSLILGDNLDPKVQRLLIRMLPLEELDRMYQPAYNTNIAGTCRARSPGKNKHKSTFMCTLPPKHDGPHIACGVSPLEAWVDETQGHEE